MTVDVLHFGAGALGRGLILPRIAGAGAAVAVADTDAELVDALRRDGGYVLSVREPGAAGEQFVPIAAAFAIGRDDDALDAVIAETRTVSTSVQVPNLPAVVGRLASSWSRAPAERILVGCENMRRVGAHLAGLFADRPARPARMPDCVVDRICATRPDGLDVEAERYTEWVVEGGGIAGADEAADVDRLFFRKRYLVNTLADAAAFLGLRRGHRFLHEAIGDGAVVGRLAPLLGLLKDHLHRAFGFERPALDDYHALSLSRLGNDAISRRLETVARDPWRKFGPAERFLEPILAEAAAGRGVDGALGVFAEILLSVDPDAASVEARLGAVWTDPSSRRLLPAISRLLRVRGA